MSTTVAEEGQAEPPTGHAVLPLPVIDWTAVVKADNPMREASRGRLRELRKKLQMSDGIVVYRRGQRGLQGRSTYYSVLSALAARSRQAGQGDSAAQLGKSASILEARFEAQLAEFLSKNDLAQLPRADFFYELTTATAQRLAEWNALPDTVLAAARIEGIADDVAHLEGASPRGGRVSIDLPRVLLDRQSLRVGDLVWVFRRVVGDAAIVELLPAVRIEVTLDREGKLPEWLPALLDVPFEGDRPDEQYDTSDGLTDQERADFAEVFRATVGGDLAAEDIAAIHEDVAAGRIAKRRLRPAG